MFPEEQGGASPGVQASPQRQVSVLWGPVPGPGQAAAMCEPLSASFRPSTPDHASEVESFCKQYILGSYVCDFCFVHSAHLCLLIDLLRSLTLK